MFKEGCELIAVSESDTIIPYKRNIVNIKTAAIFTQNQIIFLRLMLQDKYNEIIR